MESRTRLVLKHKATGLYFSNMADHTKRLFDARRFYDTEQADAYLRTSMYAPENPKEYALIPVKQTIEEEEEHANT